MWNPDNLEPDGVSQSALAELLRSLDAACPWPSTQVVGCDPVLKSPHRLATAMAVAAASQGATLAALHRLHGGPTQEVSVDIHDAAHAIHPSQHLRQNGHSADFGYSHFEPGNGFFATRDGRHCYMISTRPRLRDGFLSLLGCPNDRDAIAAAIARWDAQALEDVCAQRELPLTMVRSREEWQAHPQGRALKDQPLISIKRIGDAPAMRPLDGRRPLDGLRVLDLSHILAGPGLTRTLAEQGANVLRVTAPRQTDPVNFMIDTGFGKRSAFLDFDTPAQHAAAVQLAMSADVVVQSYSPGSLARRGLSPLALARDHPGLVYVSLSCFGDDEGDDPGAGPWAGRIGYDYNAQSATGISWTEGGCVAPQLPPTNLVADYITSYLGACGVLAALMRRSVEGGSYHVQLSLARTCMWIQQLGLCDMREAKALRPASTLRMHSPFGELEYLSPITHYSKTPAYWQCPPEPFGASLARW